jgi:hypothetical protein
MFVVSERQGLGKERERGGGEVLDTGGRNTHDTAFHSFHSWFVLWSERTYLKQEH